MNLPSARSARRLCLVRTVALDAETALDRGRAGVVPISYRHALILCRVSSFKRIVRAFLIEEQKIVKKVLAEKSKKAK